jgi:hypothetical protein
MYSPTADIFKWSLMKKGLILKSNANYLSEQKQYYLL